MTAMDDDGSACLPPPPEPSHSPEAPPNNERRVSIMSALGESVSFGRFLSESLDWGKWSSFAHNKYLEEAALHARPGSVAQKAAFFEGHYSTKKAAAEAAALAEEERVGAEGRDVGAEAIIADGGEWGAAEADSSCGYGMAAPDEQCVEPDGSQVETVEKQPLKESSVVNQSVADPVKKRRLLPMSTPLRNPAKYGSSPSVNERSPPSAKRRSPPCSVKENSSPLTPSSNGSKEATSSVNRKRSAMRLVRMSVDITRCEMGDAASPRTLGSSIAARIGQFESGSRAVNAARSEANQFRPPRKAVVKGAPKLASGTPQLREQRQWSKADDIRGMSSKAARVKETTFLGLASPSLRLKTSRRKENEAKADSEAEMKESRPSFGFKARPLPNFCRKIKQEKDSSEKSGLDGLPKDGSAAHFVSKGTSKEKQTCCFPIRRLS